MTIKELEMILSKIENKDCEVGVNRGDGVSLDITSVNIEYSEEDSFILPVITLCT